MISGKIKYARRGIQVVPREGLQRVSITKFDEPLLPKLQEVDSSERPDVQLRHCMDPLILNVPSRPQGSINASHIIFGMSTPLDRLEDSTLYIERWLPFTGARLFVVVTGSDESSPDESRMSELELKMRGLGMQVTLVKPLSKSDVGSQRYFSLTKVMYSNRHPDTQWIVWIDDDTFFPSMNTLVSMLSAYDSEKQYYIGGLSEDWWSVARYGKVKKSQDYEAVSNLTVNRWVSEEPAFSSQSHWPKSWTPITTTAESTRIRDLGTVGVPSGKFLYTFSLTRLSWDYGMRLQV